MPSSMALKGGERGEEDMFSTFLCSKQQAHGFTHDHSNYFTNRFVEALTRLKQNVVVTADYNLKPVSETEPQHTHSFTHTSTNH